MSFWQDIPKPFLAVAPMADVTDAAFRRMIAKYSAVSPEEQLSLILPDSPKTSAQRPAELLSGVTREFQAPFVMWTEFVAADGLRYATPEGKEKLLADLIYDQMERPIVAQIFSGYPDNIEQAAALCASMNFDGVDINMGCPVQKIAKQGAGSAMIRNPHNAKEVIRAARRGAGDVPVSVKTRLGFHEEEIDTWIPAVLEEQPAVLTVHCRTRKDMSKVPARWDRLTQILELRDKISPDTLIVGNGDVLSPEDAAAKIAATGVDGAMVGRALFGNPWFFHPTKRLPHTLKALPTSGVNRDELVEVRSGEDDYMQYITLPERLSVLVEHTKLFVELLPHKSFNIMKKHYKGYVNGFSGAGQLRGELMQAQDPDEVEQIVQEFLVHCS